MIGARAITGVASLLLLSGCSATLPGQDPLTKAPASASTPWQPSSEQARHPRGSADASDYARAPAIPDRVPVHDGELQLPELVDIALRNSPETRQTWAAARAAAAAYGEANAPYYPSIEVGATVGVERTEQSGGRQFFEQFNYSPLAKLSWLLLDFGARSAGAEAAWQALAASNWQHNQRIQDVVLAVATAYHMLIGRLAALSAAEANLEAAQISEKSAERLREAGVGTITDVLLARARRAQRVLDLVDRRGVVEISRGALATAMGLAANSKLDVVLSEQKPQLEWADINLDKVIDQALAQRPDMAAAWARLRASESAVSEAESDLWPTLSLEAGAAWKELHGRSAPSSSSESTDFSNRGFEGRAGLVLTYPLFEGFALSNAVRRKQALADRARADAERQEQRVIEQVWNSYQNLTTAGQRVEASNELLSSAELSYESMLISYRAGVAQIVELLQAQSTLADARSENANARTFWYIALVQLAHDMGVIPLSGEPRALESSVGRSPGQSVGSIDPLPK
jgi:outer membrane protein